MNAPVMDISVDGEHPTICDIEIEYIGWDVSSN
jgi:hypothetical protein